MDENESEDIAVKHPRDPNFTDKEDAVVIKVCKFHCQVFIYFKAYQARRDILEAKHDSKVTNELKDEKWQEIVDLVNKEVCPLIHARRLLPSFRKIIHVLEC
jgi:uncharacterized OsmC-like protein